MNRKEFLKLAALGTIAGATMDLKALSHLKDTLASTDPMPVLFVGHGSPMNAIEDNPYSRAMQAVGIQLPKPQAILMVSAHWETRGTKVTAQLEPRTIHDFGGFPRELFEVQYPAPGSEWLAREAQEAVESAEVQPDVTWGLDHGCWSVTRNMFPKADIPIVQLSLDRTQSAQYHYAVGQEIAKLRHKGVLIMGSGNMVHNLGMVAWDKLNQPFAYDWALEINNQFKHHIEDRNHGALVNYQGLGKAAALAIPTPEHYLPLLYVLGASNDKDSLAYFNDEPVGGSLTMTSVVLGQG